MYFLLKMRIFHCYVSLLEGIIGYDCFCEAYAVLRGAEGELFELPGRFVWVT